MNEKQDQPGEKQDRREKTPDPNQPFSFNRRNLVWAFIAWMVLVYFMASWFTPQPNRQLSYTRFKQVVRNDRVVSVTFKGREIIGQLRQKEGAVQSKYPDVDTTQNQGTEQAQTVPFSSRMPAVNDPDLLPLLEKHRVTIKAVPDEQPWFMTALITLLPWILIIGIILYSRNQLQKRMGGMGGPFHFGKSKAKLFDKSITDKTFDDVAGLENAKKELWEVVEYLKDPSRFNSLGGQLPKGLLLVGPPGVGKTLIAQAAAGEAAVPFFSISGSEFIEMFVGVGASRVRDMFKKAKKQAPAIIFIDEVDSIGRARGTGVGGGHDEREQTLNQILSEMDGFKPNEFVIVLAATNRPDVLDPALVRPGRFDRRIMLDLPQKKARRAIIETHTREIPLSDSADLNQLAEQTVGMSGADIRNLVNEAALLAARKDKQEVDTGDLEQARDKIMMGIEREDRITESEKELVAYHEAGHALLAGMLPGADPLQKVTIIPRGRSLGATEQVPEEDRHNLKRAYLNDRIAIMFGGRAAEIIKFEDVSNGGADDLKKATQLVKRMVCQWGMSDKIGPMVFKNGETHPFLGRELAESKDHSEAMSKKIDDEILRILRENEKKAMDTLTQHRALLDRLADALKEHETLHREEVEEIIAGVN